MVLPAFAMNAVLSTPQPAKTLKIFAYNLLCSPVGDFGMTSPAASLGLRSWAAETTVPFFKQPDHDRHFPNDIESERSQPHATNLPDQSLDYFCPMPVVGGLFVDVAQQNTESLPHRLQVCMIFVVAPLPVPTTVTVPPQPGQRCFSPGVIFVTLPLDSFVMNSVLTDLHLEQTIAISSFGLSSSACAWFVMLLSIIKCSPPFMGFIGGLASCALAAKSHPSAATVNASPERTKYLRN
jgi:hypothetical protein